jgi:hypothetical protein
MHCLVCGGDMCAVMVEADHHVGMHSFQYRKFNCGNCGDTERRFAFDPRLHDQPAMANPTVSASIVPDPPAEGEIHSKMRIADALSLPLAKLFYK